MILMRKYQMYLVVYMYFIIGNFPIKKYEPKRCWIAFKVTLHQVKYRTVVIIQLYNGASNKKVFVHQ